eukprot:gene5830-8042_t
MQNILETSIKVEMNTMQSVNQPSKRLLYMTASYTFNQFLPLQRVLDGLRDICNAGWQVTIHLQVSNGLNYDNLKYEEIKEQTYCIRSSSHIPIIIEEYGKIGFGLNSKHRSYVLAHIDDFDVFIYGEEDMVMTLSHFYAYLNLESKLRETLPNTWMRYFIGYLRYEDSIITSDRISWEYYPSQIHIGDMGSKLGKFIVTNNLNQAIYILSREHLLDLEKRCDFLSKPGQNEFYRELRRAMNLDWKYMSVGVSEWSSSFQQILQCGMRRIIPLDHFYLHFMSHGSNIAQKRRLKKDHMSYKNWTDVLSVKLIETKNNKLRTIKQIYDDIIYKQYNLHLIDKNRFGSCKWSWGEGFEDT